MAAAAVVAAAGGAIAAGADRAGNAAHPTPPAPGEIVANVGVTTGSCDSTPTRLSSPVRLADLPAGSLACTWDQAWDAAAAGDTVGVKAGTYPTQRLTGDKAAETRIVAEDGTVVNTTQECRPEFGAVSVICMEAANLTLENVTLDSGRVAGQASITRVWPGAEHVTWRNVRAHGDHPFVYVEAAHFTWDGGELGEDDDGLPRQTCTTPGGEPLWLQAGADGATINEIRFRRRLVQETPTPNTGTCGADGFPHLELIRLEDTDGVTICNSRFDPGSDAGSGLLFTSQDVDDLTLCNNFLGAVNGTYWVQASGAPGRSGWKLLYNTFVQAGRIDDGLETSTWIGNLGQAAPDCVGTRTKNVWAGSGACGTDTFTGSTRLGFDPSDGTLEARSPAIDAGETSSCHGPLVAGIDLEGDKRPPGSACDAGADERSR